ncbi:MAG: GerMN domain-containing protein [Clostridia bacterium]|nr:GerMN domain-containing protein [Clostridia bacterium]
MKRVLSVLFAVLLLTSCSSERREPEGNIRWIDVYYADTGDKIIDSEQRAISVEDSITAAITASVEQMQHKPIGDNLKPAIPEEIKLLGVKFDHGAVKISFSEEYANLQGFDKTVADYAILMTLSNFWNVQSVEILAGDRVVTPAFSQRKIVTEMPTR